MINNALFYCSDCEVAVGEFNSRDYGMASPYATEFLYGNEILKLIDHSKEHVPSPA